MSTVGLDRPHRRQVSIAGSGSSSTTVAMANAPGWEAYYGNLTAYAKSIGLKFVVGNPGADTAPS